MIVDASLSATPIDPASLLAAVARPEAGATSSFVGTVRDHDPDARGEVVRLEYTAHPDAERVLRELAAAVDAAELRVAVRHRVGRLEVGDVAIVCAVSAPHRREAIAACAELVERVKAELPVWKRQLEADGRAAWIGLGEAGAR